MALGVQEGPSWESEGAGEVGDNSGVFGVCCFILIAAGWVLAVLYLHYCQYWGKKIVSTQS